MTRKKVKLAYISNESSRKATFNKRKKGLLKKVNELSTLCGVKACAIVYSEFDSNPAVWPSDAGVRSVVSEFKAFPDMDQRKKMMDPESFLRKCIDKTSKQLERQRRENKELEMTEVMFRTLVGNMDISHMNILDLNNLGFIVDQYLNNVNRRLENLQNSGMEIGESSNAGAAASERIGSLELMVSANAPTARTNEAPFFNPIQPQQHHQQFRHPSPSHVSFYEQLQNLNLNGNHNHSQNQQQWFMGMMNHPEQLNYAAEQMDFPFMDDNHHYHHQPQHQEQQIPSTVPTVVSSSGTISIINPNPTNNI